MLKADKLSAYISYFAYLNFIEYYKISIIS